MNFVFTDKPPKFWGELCSQQGDLFNTPQWHAVLSKGFGSNTLYGWDEATSIGLTITVFKAGPFRVGYLGFPVGGTVGSATISPEMIEGLKKTEFHNTIHCIRIPVSAFAEDDDLPLPAQVTPETAIENLQEWRLKNPKVRGKINKARRSPLRIIDTVEPSFGKGLFRIYLETILRVKGNIRYTAEYFCALIDLAENHPNLSCRLAMIDGKVIGFAIVACHGRGAYYLHGFSDHSFRHFCPSDLLLYDAINLARQKGVECFSMMASPVKQPSLVQYKEKWGGVTRQQQTYELALRPFQTMMFKAGAKLYEGIPILRDKIHG